VIDNLVQLIVWLNALANALGYWLLAPIGMAPGWLSATVIAVVTGVLLLIVFKYTSAQRTIKRVRDDINANLLALKLFKDSARATIHAQGRLLWGAGRLLVLALVPTAIMALPVALVLGQLSLWYQQRPVKVEEDVDVTLSLNGPADAPLPHVSLQPTDAVETLVGPVRIFSQRQVCWKLAAREPGYHRLSFQVGDQVVEKELAVGDGFMRASAERPAWIWTKALEFPSEEPFPPDATVHSIEIKYPERKSWTCGTDRWVIYWFGVSLAAAFCFRRLLRVQV
jgi:hypothetical protein